MILNLEKADVWNFAKRAFNFIFLVRTDLTRHNALKKLFRDSKELQKLYYFKYPNLVQNEEENIICVSCGLCAEVCPVNAIEIKKNEMFNLPSSPTEGGIPSSFKLNVDTCNQCNLCSIVCAVDAIELKGEYQDASVDLVQKINLKKPLS